MYHCHIDFYCIGHQPDMFDKLRDMSPLESFTHSFTISEEPDRDMAARADVILADLEGMDGKSVLEMLTSCKKERSELILLADKEQIALLAENLSEVKDIWTTPMSDEELRFRFLRWQQACKQNTDHWQTSNYLEAAINSSPNLVWYKAKSGVHEKVNDSFCRAVNKPKEDVEGQCHAYIWGVEEEDPACIESDREVMESGDTHVSEETIQTSAGERLLTTYKSPLYDLDGSVMGTVGVALDITQERAYEEDILKKSRTLEWLLTTMECGVLCHTVDGSRIISVNRAALHILGYESQEEMEADGFATVAASVLDEDKPKLRECIQKLHRANESSNTEYRVLHKDGKLLHVMGNIKLVEENGEWFYQRFLLDCTAQKLREQAQQLMMDQKIQYQEQLFNIFSTYLAYNTDDVYMMLNATVDKVEYLSPNFERVLGIPAESIDTNLYQFSKAKYLSGEPIIRSDLCRMEPGEALEPRETEWINQQTGERKWFRDSIYCVSLQNEKKIVAYISDRTKERNTQDTLAEALEMAQVANRAKSAFLSSVSHDIRTPMNAIIGFITLLKQEAGNKERVLEYSQRIDTASQHLLGLINDVLDMNKIESGSSTLNLAEFNLADVIDEINAIIRPQARAKDQTFEIHVSSLAYEHLIGDRMRINQILINILSNAVKYTQNGGMINMTVTELPQVVDDYSRIQFTIADNGQGMSEAYQEVIFNPFTREQDTLINQVQGTGLGMSITKNLVELMNGSIRVESKLGCGSTFTVELELLIQEQETDLNFWEDRGIERMMIVDDDESICASIMSSMADTGVHVEFATDGRTAVDRICAAQQDGRPFDLILLDWMMQGLSGLETARLIRSSTHDKPPVILVSAYDWEDIKKEASDARINRYLPKPFFMSNFKEAIRGLSGGGESLNTSSEPDKVVEGKHILVVDDIDVNRVILVKILNTLGATCETATNGQEALDMFEASEPGYYDIIMMDIQMPIMDGYTASKAIRKSSHPSANKVAVIAMTANAFVDDVREALMSGMDAHVAKPIVVDKMLATIREVLYSKGQ